MKVAIITAGGAGMFCGSCMQDNTLARTLRLADVDAVLVPTYTPIRVDEEDVSDERVFLGGINVYLDSAIPGWKRLPAWLTGWLNRPSVIRTLSRLGSTDASRLGSLTLDMLRGTAGPQQREIREFADYLCDELKPDVVLFSNALLSGMLSALKPRFPGQVFCLLQGDDIFLDALSKRWRPAVMEQMKTNCAGFDGFLTHSRYYRDHMCDYLGLTADAFAQIPLTIEGLPGGLSADQTADPKRGVTIGYFARICPEKGIHNFLAAAETVLPEFPSAQVQIAGYLPKERHKWFHRLLARAQSAAPGRVHWLSSPETREQKFAIIRQFDHLCVPTDYHEPKGLYVLEAALCEVPSILPRHGAFPELVDRLQTGTLYDATTPEGLSNAFRDCLQNPEPAQAALSTRALTHYGMSATASVIRTAITDLCGR